jgi:DNA invertase Pin-like site-specific DNA recombinase
MRIGYCRVSTKSAEQTASVESQALRLKECGCDQVLVDHGISGFRDEGRKGSCFPKLIDLILEGVATEVVVPHFDRTQRRLKWGMQLLDALESTGVRLLELDTGTWLDPANNPTDVLMAQIRTAVQENESRVRRLKVRRALDARRARGDYASGHIPFGYAVEGGKVVPHPDNWEAAKERWRQLEEMDFNLAGWLKRYEIQITPRGIKAWVINPTLRGDVNRRPGMTCEPLITAEQWAKAEWALSIRSLARGVGGSRQVRLFTGLVRCESCGKNLHTVCERRTPRLKCKTRQCSWYGRGLQVAEVRRQVIKALAVKNCALADLAASDDQRETPEQLKLRADIEGLERLLHLPGVEQLVAQQRNQLAALTVRSVAPKRDMLRELFANPATLDLATDEELRPIVIEFVASIVWLGGLESVRITLR